MKLPNLTQLIGQKAEQEDIFVSFIIGKNWIQAGLWQIREGRGELLTSGTTDAWEDSDSFIQAADDSLSSAMGSRPDLPEEVKSVVFGLPSFWLDDGNIKQERLGDLRSLCEKLDLKPAGFVVVPEAIIHFLTSEEGSPASCILVGIEEEELDVMLVKGGKILNSQTVSRSISLPDDITEGLSRLGVSEPLPARIVLFNRHKTSLEEEVQTLLSWEWPVVFFLHTPRVESFSPDMLLSAVSAAAAQEITQVQEFIVPKRENEEVELENVPKQNASKQQQEVMEKEAKELPIPIKEPETEAKITRQINLPIHGILSKFTAIFSRLFRVKGKLRLLLIIGLFSLFAFIFIWWFVPKATVTVFVTPKTITESISIIVDPTGGSDQGKVSGRLANIEVSGEKTRATTGTKTTGDRAKGEIVILNNTSQAHSFPGGTLLTGPNGLKFTLDAPVTVASESGAPIYLPGTAKAAVTAADIGAEHNLTAGSVFSLANFSTSSFSAKNETQFSGGSSREVPAVSKDDQKKLEEELSIELTDKVKTQILAQVKENEAVINESAKINILKRTFSGNAGSETQTLKLTMMAQGQIVVVSRENLNSALLGALRPKVPPDFSLQDQGIKASFVGTEEQKTSGLVNFKADITGLLVPNINTKQMAGQINGKSPLEVRTKLASISGMTRVTIKISPPLPFISNLPQRSENITIKVVTEP